MSSYTDCAWGFCALAGGENIRQNSVKNLTLPVFFPLRIVRAQSLESIFNLDDRRFGVNVTQYEMLWS